MKTINPQTQAQQIASSRNMKKNITRDNHNQIVEN